MMSFADILRRILVTRNERGLPTSDWIRLMTRKVTRRMVGDASGRILDVGGGEGLLFDPHISGSTDNVVVLDITGDDLLTAAEHYNGKGYFVCGDLTSLPFADNTFDVSVCISTYINLSGSSMVQSGLHELARVTKPYGRIIVEFRNADNAVVGLSARFARHYDKSLNDLPVIPYHFTTVADMISAAGLRITRVSKVRLPFLPLAFAFVVEAVHKSVFVHNNKRQGSLY